MKPDIAEDGRWVDAQSLRILRANHLLHTRDSIQRSNTSHLTEIMERIHNNMLSQRSTQLQ